jgi:hypothetical protein
MNTTTPTFETAYAETKRAYETAGLPNADLSWLTEEFFADLLTNVQQQAALTSLASISDTVAVFPPEIGDLVHHVVHLEGDRILGYEASETGGCQMLIPIDTHGTTIPVRKCGSGGVDIFRILPV